MKSEEAMAWGTFLSFSLFGFNRGEEIIVPGTGFCVAPGLALSAKHVTEEIFPKLAIPEGLPLPRNQTFYDGVEVRAEQQEIEAENTELTPWWRVDGFLTQR